MWTHYVLPFLLLPMVAVFPRPTEYPQPSNAKNSHCSMKEDEHDECRDWARAGQNRCDDPNSWETEHCKKSCCEVHDENKQPPKTGFTQKSSQSVQSTPKSVDIVNMQNKSQQAPVPMEKPRKNSAPASEYQCKYPYWDEGWLPHGNGNCTQPLPEEAKGSKKVFIIHGRLLGGVCCQPRCEFLGTHYKGYFQDYLGCWGSQKVVNHAEFGSYCCGSDCSMENDERDECRDWARASNQNRCDNPNSWETAHCKKSCCEVHEENNKPPETGYTQESKQSVQSTPKTVDVVNTQDKSQQVQVPMEKSQQNSAPASDASIPEWEPYMKSPLYKCKYPYWKVGWLPHGNGNCTRPIHEEAKDNPKVFIIHGRLLGGGCCVPRCEFMGHQYVGYFQDHLGCLGNDKVVNHAEFGSYCCDKRANYRNHNSDERFRHSEAYDYAKRIKKRHG